MSTPLFDLLARNLAVPDEDRGDAVNMSPATVKGMQIAYRLVGEGETRPAACRRAAIMAGCSHRTLYCCWNRYVARLQREGLL